MARGAHQAIGPGGLALDAAGGSQGSEHDRQVGIDGVVLVVVGRRAEEQRPRVTLELGQDERIGPWPLAADELALAAGSANRSTELPSGSRILA